MRILVVGRAEVFVSRLAGPMLRSTGWKVMVARREAGHIEAFHATRRMATADARLHAVVLDAAQPNAATLMATSAMAQRGGEAAWPRGGTHASRRRGTPRHRGRRHHPAV